MKNINYTLLILLSLLSGCGDAGTSKTNLENQDISPKSLPVDENILSSVDIGDNKKNQNDAPESLPIDESVVPTVDNGDSVDVAPKSLPVDEGVVPKI
jgi:hypothetical protein